MEGPVLESPPGGLHPGLPELGDLGRGPQAGLVGPPRRSRRMGLILGGKELRPRECLVTTSVPTRDLGVSAPRNPIRGQARPQPRAPTGPAGPQRAGWKEGWTWASSPSRPWPPDSVGEAWKQLSACVRPLSWVSRWPRPQLGGAQDLSPSPQWVMTLGACLATCGLWGH